MRRPRSVSFLFPCLSLMLAGSVLAACDPPNNGGKKDVEPILGEQQVLSESPKQVEAPGNLEVESDNVAQPTVVPRCPDTRWIVQSCQPVENWQAEPLFNPANRSGGTTHANLKSLLDGYCVYTWSGTGTLDFKPILALSPTAGRDCHVTLAGPPFGGSIAELADDFAANIGLPAPQNNRPLGKSNVTVAVIDNGTAKNSDSTHGDIMARIIETITQRYYLGSTAISVKKYPKVDIGPSDKNRRPPSDTHDLYQSDVIAAIVDALLDNAKQRAKLIINLSVAWDAGTSGPVAVDTEPGHSGQHRQDYRGTSTRLAVDEALQRVLNLAHNDGVLVFAAAGNKILGTCDTPDLPMPAALRAVSTDRGKLVYAVDAVDEHDQPLPTNRASGDITAMGRLAVVAKTYGDTHYYDPLTGTSVATAVTSGIAAVLWGKSRGDFDATDVANTLMRSETPIKACTMWGLDALCPDNEDPDTIWARTVVTPSGATAVPDASFTLLARATCEPQPDNIAWPQPPKGPCSNCGLKKPASSPRNGQLQLQLDNYYLGYSTPTIAVTIKDGTTAYTFTYTGLTLSTTEPKLIDGSGASGNFPESPVYAYVTMTLQDPTGAIFSAGNEIPIL